MDMDSDPMCYNHIPVVDEMGDSPKADAVLVQGSRSMVVEHPQASYSCDDCDRVFTEKSNLMRHVKTHNRETYCFKCRVCEKTFTRNEHLKRHFKLHSDVAAGSGSSIIVDDMDDNFQAETQPMQGDQAVSNQRSYPCDDCNKVLAEKSSLVRHQKTHNRKNCNYKCEVCRKIFTREEHLKRHFKLHSDVPYRLPQHIRKCKPMQQLGTFSVFKINPTLKAEYDMSLFIKELKIQVHEHLLDHIGAMDALKWYGRMCCLMIRGKPETVLVRVEKSMYGSKDVEKLENKSEYKSQMMEKSAEASEDEFEEVENPDENRIIDKFYFNCTAQILLNDSQVEGQLTTAFGEITNRFEEFTHLGSGWRLKQIIVFELSLCKYIGLTGKAFMKSKKVKNQKL